MCLAIISFSVTSGTEDESPATDIMRGISISHGKPKDITWYEPEYEPWLVHDFKVYPICGRKLDGSRQMRIVAIQKTDRPVGLQSLDVSVDGALTNLKLKRSDVDVDTSGCRVAQTVKVADQDRLVRAIVAAKEVVVQFNGIRSENSYHLTKEDLGDFKHILAICDTQNLGDVREEPRSVPDMPGTRAGTAGVTNPVLIRETKRDPEFPEIAIEKQRRGSVTLHAVVLKDGTVGIVEVLKSTTRDCGFEEAAIAAVKTWRYHPGLKDGKPVDIYFTVDIDFYWGH